MKVQNVLNALKKIGVKIEVKERFNSMNEKCSDHYICYGKKNKCDWYQQFYDKDNVDAIQVMRLHEENDLMSDYFAGQFYHTIKSLVKVMGE